MAIIEFFGVLALGLALTSPMIFLVTFIYLNEKSKEGK